MKLMRDNNKKTERSALRRAAAPLAVVLILLLAGCAGMGGGGDASPESPNVTDESPATNTTNSDDTADNSGDDSGTTEQINADFANKFTTDNGGLVSEIDGFDMGEAHEESLVENYESFTVEGESSWDGVLPWDQGYAVWGAESADGFIHHERVIDAPGEQVWVNFRSVEASERKRIRIDNGTRTVEQIDPNVEPVVGGEDFINHNRLGASYEFAEYRDDNGTIVAVFEASEPSDWMNDDRLADDVSADAVEGEMWITENGVVRQSNLTAFDGDDVVYDSEFRVSNFNSTEVQPPTWAEDYAEEHGYNN